MQPIKLISKTLSEIIHETRMSPLTSSEGVSALDRRAFLAGLASTTLLAAGCGADTYQERLTQTRRYFEYLDQVNVALSRVAKFEGFEIRVPKIFEQLIPAAVPNEGEAPKEGEAAPEPLAPDVDPVRLGYFPNVMPEGIMASWKATVRTEGPGQSEGEAPAYLHLLSNWGRWIERQNNIEIDPPKYLADLTNQIANALNLQADTSDAPWDWEMIRGLSPFVAKKKIESITIELVEHNPPLEIHFYKTDAKDVQCALLLILPKAIDPREKMEGRIKLTLETLKLPGSPPEKAPAKGAPVGGF